MTEGTQINAMVEIALALAMAFFALMVLAFISMGAGFASKGVGAVSVLTANGVPVAGMPTDRPANQSEVPAEAEVTAQAIPPDALLIFHGGRFLDAELTQADPATFAQGKVGVFLAVAADLAFADAADARLKVAAADVTVVPLDGKWAQALKELNHDKP
ncbi:MAG: hypothetical protein CMF64_13910 [Magnetovibrio sp.]|nr:hypothetical protein [Magnetovibrio sp.]